VSSVSPPGPVTADGLIVAVNQVRSVEGRAARAWPETTHYMLDGWRLRHSPGIANRRANSVLPLWYSGDGQIDAAIDTVEAFYRDRKSPSRFMISPASDPPDLDQILDVRGYHIDAPTDVQWARGNDVIEATDAAIETKVMDRPDLNWMSVYMEGTTDRAEIATKHNLIGRIGGRKAAVRIDVEGRAVSVGLGVFDDGWTGVFCMHTLIAHRRQGYGRAVLGALSRWGVDQGGEDLYLQVERDNPVARSFYERSGFATKYGYYYRTRKV